MNRRVCSHCKADDSHFGSSPYGSTCLACGFTDPDRLDRPGELTRLLVQRLGAATMLCFWLYVVWKVWTLWIHRSH